MRTFQWFSLGLLAALPLAACTCGEGSGIKALHGNLDSPLLVDFGNVLVGITATQDLEVSNKGNGTVRVTKVELGPDISSPTYEFKVIPTTAFQLAPQEKKKLKVTFLPLAAGDAMSTFQFVTDETDPANSRQKKSVTVRVIGKGIVAGLRIDPNPADFGTVLAGASHTLDIKITNELTVAVDVTTKVGADGKAEVTNQVGQGRFEILSMVQSNGSLLPGSAKLGAGESVTVQARYTPDAAASGTQDRAKWVVSNCPDPLCDVPVILLGRGTNAALECMPASINFGDVNPGRTLSRMVTCKNTASDNITIAPWKIDMMGSAPEFSVTPYAGTPTDVQPGDQFNVEVKFSPTLATLRAGMTVSGTLVVPGINPRSGRDLTPVRIELTGKAGGPTISVAPTSLAFGRVAVGTTARRRLLVANSGYSTLVVSMIVADGMSGRMFVPDRVLLSLPVGTSTVVNVAFTPTIEGPIMSDLVLSSNDSAVPELHVPMTGQGAMLPPCVYTVTPSNVNFGPVPTFEMRTVGVRVQNVGTDPCLLNDIEVTTATAATRSRFFRLVNGNETGIMLDAGQSKDLPIMYAPRLAGNDRGILTFYISDPMNSTPQIPLFGIAEASTNVVCPPDVTTPAGTAVTLTADAMSIGGTITSINWTVTSSPTGGTGTPSFWTPNPPTARTETVLPYIVGRYTLHVAVRDSNGRMASCDTHVTAIGHGLRVQLTWDGSGDMDLHVHNQNMTQWFSPPNDDCYYANRNPIWDAMHGPAMGGNPQLDFDNVTGFGPENTRIDVVEIGVPYTVAAHNYARAEGRISTIQIFCGGVTMPNATFVSMPATGSSGGNCTVNSFWKVATVTFSSQSQCVITPINQYGPSSQFCSMF